MIDSTTAYNENVLSEEDLLVIPCEVERLFQYVENAVLVARDRQEGSKDVIRGEKMLPTECDWSGDHDNLVLAWKKRVRAVAGKRFVKALSNTSPGLAVASI